MSSSYLDQRIVAVKPITVPAPDRGIDLQVKVTAPLSGQNLPVIVFSHGNAWSLDGYEPLVDRWAAAGFVVVQPTHLDSRRNGLGWDDPRFATVWRVRIADLHAVLDGLDDILLQAAWPGDPRRPWTHRDRRPLLGRPDRRRAPRRTRARRRRHTRRRLLPLCGRGFYALIAATGTGDTLTPFAAEHLPFMRPDYSTMTTPALVVAGGKDRSQLSTRGPEWFTDAYRLSPSPKSLLTIAEGEHTLGGIAGEMVAETTDEDPARVARVADAVSAYLLDALKLNSAAWTALDNATEAGDSTWSISSK